MQSLSIVVPAKKCINDCKFCVANTEEYTYDNFITGRNLYFDLYYKQYKERMEYARDNGCNSVMLTGNCEPQQDYEFLKLFGIINQSLEKPFRNIEMQTTGTLLDDDYLYFLRHHVGVTTISLSVSSFINDEMNNNIINSARDINLKYLVSRIKKYKFTLRLSINLSKFTFNTRVDSYEEIFKKLKKDYKADQLTFRVLYDGNTDKSQDIWVRENKLDDIWVERLNNYIKENGRFLEKLEFGADRYSVNGMSVVLDEDCMSTNGKDVLKYTILRPDCRLYTKWDDVGSLLF
jgi:sulfatase maturation enzyme AslB (radical SAM superfamily)